MLMSVRWLIATAAVGLTFALAWVATANIYDLGDATSAEVAAVSATLVGLPLSWWSFRGQLLDEPVEVGWVTWRRVPAAPAGELRRPEQEAALTAALSTDRPSRRSPGTGRSASDRRDVARTSPVAVLTGAPGSGKTQLAAGYARSRMAEGLPLVVWVDAAGPEELVAGLLEYADAMGLRVPEEGSSRAVERLLSRGPSTTEPSLLVFDGVTDPGVVRPYLPAQEGWRVIVTADLDTAAASTAAALGTEVVVGPPAVGELADWSGLSEPLCAALGGLPATVQLAVATTRELSPDPARSLTDREYRNELESVPVAELLTGGPDATDHAADHPAGRDSYPAGVAEAVLLTLDGAGFDTDPVARRLLGTLAVLSPVGADRALLHRAGEPPEVEEALRRLSRWALVSGRMDGDSVVAHRLVSRVVSDRLRAEDGLATAVAEASDLLWGATFGEEQAWNRRGEGDQLVAHIAALSTSAGAVSSTLPPAAAERVLGLHQWATRQLSAVGDGTRAVELADGIRAECDTLLGAEHPDTLAASDNLVIAYVAAGRSGEAVPLAEDVLDTREQVLGPLHPDTLASRYSVAYAHEYAGRPDEAGALYEQAHADYSEVFGPDNPQTATVAAALSRVRQSRAVPPVDGGGRHRPAARPATS